MSGSVHNYLNILFVNSNLTTMNKTSLLGPLIGWEIYLVKGD